MKLSVGDRLMLLKVLPEKGSLLTMRIVHELRMALSFSEEEAAQGQFVQDGQVMHWAKEFDTEIEIGTAAQGIIVDALRVLDEKRELTEGHLSLWGKFVEG